MKKFTLLFLLFIQTALLGVTVFNSTQAGDWDNPITWGGVVTPTAFDTVNIYHGVFDDDMPSNWYGVINVDVAGTFFMDDYITFNDKAQLIVNGTLITTNNVTMADTTRATINGSTTIGSDWILSGVSARADIGGTTVTIGGDWIISGGARLNVIGTTTTIGNDWILSGDARMDDFNSTTTVGNDWILSGNGRYVDVGSTITVNSDWILSGDARMELLGTCLMVNGIINIRDNSLVVGSSDVGVVSGVVNFSGGATINNIGENISIYTIPDTNTCVSSCGLCPLILTGTYVGTLPIELSSFIVTTNNCSNILKWVSSSEKNSSHYIVQLSFDGDNFTNIVNIPTKGDESNGSVYSYIDEQNKLSYYRLEMVDNDGSTQYSDVVSAKGCELGYINVYPTTTDNNINVVTNLDGNETLNLTIVNILGQKVFSRNIENGINRVNFNISSGIYFVVIEGKHYRYVREILIK